MSSLSFSARASSTTDDTKQAIDWKPIRELALGPIIPAFGHTLTSLMRQITNVTKHILQIAHELQQAIAGFQFTATFMLPFAVKEMAENIDHLIFKKRHKGDHLLEVIKGASEVAEGVADTAEALCVVLALELIWPGPLCLAAACVNTVSWIIHGIGIYKGDRMLKTISHNVKEIVTEDGVPVAKGGVPILKSNGKPKRKINAKEFIRVLKRSRVKHYLKSQLGIENTIDPKDPSKKTNALIQKIKALRKENDSEKKIADLYKDLKTRMKRKIAVHAIGIVATLIGLVASAILFATVLAPWVIAGCVLLGALCIVSMVKMGIDYESKRQFTQILKT